jgi:hypothetical protein
MIAFDFKYINALIFEGMSVGRTPWTASFIYQDIVFEILNQTGDYPQETAEETITRRQLMEI